MTSRAAAVFGPPTGRSLLRPALLFLALQLPGCRDATDPEKQRVVGAIDRLGTTPPTIVAPAEATVNQPFVVTVYTWGSSDCTKPDGVSLALVGELVRIVPYDIIPIPGHTDVCRDDYAPHAHPFEVTLSRAGSAVLRVVGRRASRAEAILDSVEVGLTVAP